MAIFQVLWFYIIWHYTKAWRDIIRIVGNYLWFVGNFFSIGLLFRTLFYPWRRLSVQSGKGAKDNFLGAFLVNTLMRGAGFLIRSVTIVAGLAALCATFLLSLVLVVAWFGLPIIVFFLFFGGLGQIIQSVFKLP